MVYWRIYRCLAALTMFALVGGCSDIPLDTFEVEVTTDRDPHIVELWYHPNARSNEFRRAYRLKFPQSYYGYRDNHKYLKQTAIGLVLDKQDLMPLTEVVAKETGIHEALSISPAFEGALKKKIWDSYVERMLWVVIRGLYGRPALTRTDMSRVFVSAPVVYHDIDRGFDIVEDSSKESTSTDLPLLRGYSSEGTVIRMTCSQGVPNCSFGTEYRNSSIDFSLPRSEAAKAHVIVPKLLDLIERHFVGGEE